MLVTTSLHILCFGDSLTRGYYQEGRAYHPYTIALQSSLEESFPAINFTLDNHGENGDQAASPPGIFLPRMKTIYDELHPSNPYDYAIIMGGTNDLDQNRNPKDIYTALQAVWGIPLSHNTKVLALTVPDCAGCGDVSLPLSEMNALIMKHEAQNFYKFDFHPEIPYWNITEEQREEYWDDVTHFTPKGYDLMGNLVADTVRKLIIEVEKEDRQTQNVMIGKGELKKRRRGKMWSKYNCGY